MEDMFDLEGFINLSSKPAWGNNSRSFATTVLKLARDDGAI